MRKRHQDPLTPERIIDTAAALATEEGVLRLSMRRLGRRLGVDPMAIYYYFPSKEVLFEALRTRVVNEIPNPNDPALAWYDRLNIVMYGFRTALHRYAHLHLLFVLQHNSSPEVRERVEHEIRVLRDAGFDEVSAAMVFRTLTSYVNGYVLGENSRSSRMVSDLFPAERGEANRPALETEPPDGTDERAADELAFVQGLEAIIAGFRHLLEQRHPPQNRPSPTLHVAAHAR